MGSASSEARPAAARRAAGAPLVLDLLEVRSDSIGLVGGKNAALGGLLGELSSDGLRVPAGYVEWLATLGIDSISLVPDSLPGVAARLAIGAGPAQAGATLEPLEPRPLLVQVSGQGPSARPPAQPKETKP